MSLAARSVAALALSIFAAGCGGSQGDQPVTVAQESAEAEVTRIATVWISTEVEKSLLSPPSPISVRAQTRTSRLELQAGSGREALSIEEQFDLRAGGTIRCRTRFEHVVSLRWGRKSGEAALEITRPVLSATRTCDGTPPEAILTEPERRALFVLGSDQLTAVEPPLDERIYRPAAE